MSSAMAASIFTLGRKSTTYSAPRYSSVWPFCRPKPLTSVTVMPCTPTADSASRTSSSLNGLMIAVISFMDVGSRECKSERLADRDDHAALAGAVRVLGHREPVLLAGGDQRRTRDPARTGDVVRHAELVVVDRVGPQAELLAVLDLLPADVAHDAEAAAEIERAGQVDVLRALGIDARRAQAEEVRERVVVLRRQGTPRATDVHLPVLGIEPAVHAARLAGPRVEVVDGPDVEREVAEGRLVAAVEIHLEAGAAVQVGVDVRVPVAEIEAGLVGEVDATLQRRVVVGLRVAAEPVVAEQADVARDRVLGLRLGGRRLREHGKRRRAGSGDDSGDEGFLHGFLPLVC